MLWVKKLLLQDKGMTLFQKLQKQVIEWRKSNYKSTEYPELYEILRYSRLEDASLRFLREPQFEAIETYLYIRYILKTPHTIDLYKSLFQDDPVMLFTTLGITHIGKDAIDYVDIEAVLEGIKNNDKNIVQKHSYHALQEALQLDYASYILALVMGAGKTILIASIIGIEFSIALNRTNKENEEKIQYMKNALIFAKGTTIIESLREISMIDFSKIVPPYLYKKLAPNLKIHYITKNDKEFDGVIAESNYNILITNTEKITLRKNSTNKGMFNEKEEQKKLEANRRLQKITSLPNVAIFSDEAHNTYGQSLEKDLKRVRETINYIHENKEIVCVINTTGTPYFKKQALKEVVYWYSLEQGIKDNILKSVENNIVSYNFEQENEEDIIEQVVEDFFAKYGSISLPTGQTAKIAFYFKTIKHLEASKKIIEKKLVTLSLAPSLILVNTGEASEEEKREFNSLNASNSQKRIILLVAKGVEGWNCPSLFATALIKEQTSSNNFVLQASARCLRQVPNNTHLAKIYLSSKNKDILNKELQDTYKTSITDFEQQHQPKITELRPTIRKEDIPKLIIRKKIKKVRRKTSIKADTLQLQIPPTEEKRIFQWIYRLEEGQLQQSDMKSKESTTVEYCGIYNVAAYLASNYHLHYIDVIRTLKKQYPSCMIPHYHIADLSLQIEKQIQTYEEFEETITQAIAVIKIQDEQGNYNFSKNKDGFYYHTIKCKEESVKELKVEYQKHPKNNNDIGFHFDIYKFDSAPEKDFFNKVLERLSIDKREVEDIYFTGFITDKNKTDFYFEYQNEDKHFVPYYPDFLIRKKDGKCLIVEIKSKRDRNTPEVLAKEKAMKTILVDNSDKFQYEIISTNTSSIDDNNEDWVRVLSKIYTR